METFGGGTIGGGNGGGSGAGELRQQPYMQGYMQLALYLAGNALTVIISLLIWNLNTVLADFRDSMLYALLCSIALRPVKEWLVAQLDASLADQKRSVGSALLGLAALPLNALVDAWEEGRAILAKWRQAVQEEFQRRQAALKRAAAAAAAATPGSPRTPRTAAAAAATAAKATAAPLQTMPSLAVYGHAAVRVLKSRRTSKKRRKQRQAARRAPEGSNLLFRWLFRCLAAWLAWEWVRDSWSTTVQVVLLVFTALVALGLVPLLLLTTRSYLSSTMFSPAKTPAASATPGTAAESHPRRGLQDLSPPRRPVFSPFPSEARARRKAAGKAAHADGGAAAAAAWGRCSSAMAAAKVAAASLVASLESGLRSALRTNLHALVSLMLILVLFVGTTGLAAFLSVRVAQEGRNTVLAVRDVFPAAWAGMAASTPLLADAEAAAAASAAVRPAGESGSGGGGIGGAGGGGGGKGPAAAAAAALPAWVASYQAEALQLVQQALPAVATWGEAQFYGFVEKQNLTAALSDIRLLYETLQGPRQCSEQERQKLAVAAARAEVALAAARAAKAQADQRVDRGRSKLHAAVVRLESMQSSSSSSSSSSTAAGIGGTSSGPLPPTMPAVPAGDGGGAGTSGKGAQHEQHERHPHQENEAPAAHSFPPAGEGEAALSRERVVVSADAALSAAKAQHHAAALALDSAEREQRAAQSRLRLCSAERQGGPQSSLLPGLAGEVAASLQRAYAKLWRRQFREGGGEMRRAGAHCLASLRGMAQRGSGAVADLSSLQRLAQAAADPLIAVGRVAGRLFAGSVGSTTAAALMGGLGVLRLGMGVVKWGMQLMLFLALLYYLLAAQADPLLAAAGVLPLSEQGRQRTAVALNRALGGVLVSSMKLIAFHGCFSWLTFRVMQLPLTYTASVASAVCALLPFVPTYAAALPGCVVLLAQGRLLASLLFFALHFMGYYIADTAILEDIPGGHPYLLSLGILGGIYAFENPLQGCLLGPILLSLLSVFYNLHSEFMGSAGGGAGGGGGSTPVGGPLHRLWSVTPGGPAAGTHHHKQQQPTAAAGRPMHVRLAPGSPLAYGGSGSGGSPGQGLRSGLRVSIPSRDGALAEEEGGDGDWPDQAVPGDALPAAAASLAQQAQRAERSVSLSLGSRPGSGRQPSPALVAAAGSMGSRQEESALSDVEEGSLGVEADGIDEDSVSPSTSVAASASIGDSFSFAALRSYSKLHDD